MKHKVKPDPEACPCEICGCMGNETCGHEPPQSGRMDLLGKLGRDRTRSVMLLAERGSMDDIVVLFVEPDSVYKRMGLDCYDKARDAQTYSGNAPVVAHPPCQLWGSLASVNFARLGGEHNRPGNDGGLFRFALNTVRRCGGVLEHPAKTRAWAAHGLMAPTGIGWQACADGGWVCEVWQSAYGHRANKATWLYLVGEPAPLRWQRPRGTHQIGFHDQRGKKRNKPTLGRREANATPEAFAVELVRLARGCNKHNNKIACRQRFKQDVF